MSKLSINDLDQATTLDQESLKEIHGGLWGHHSTGVPGGYWYSSEYQKNAISKGQVAPLPGDPDSPDSTPKFGAF